MTVSRSEEYYFSSDNLVIQVEDTLFRLHRGTLELHSGLFRDMFSISRNDDQEGTSDERPLRLPQDLCSAEAFTTLCQLIFPKIMGVFPPILVNEFDKWGPVLEATETLQMIGVQNYILTQFRGNVTDSGANPAKLLGWAMRSEVQIPLDTIKFECFCALAYRCRPLSVDEINALGGKATSLVMCIREKIRLFLLDPASAKSLLTHIPADPLCDRKSNCRDDILKKVTYKLTKTYPYASLYPERQKNDFDIFRVLTNEVPNATFGCRSQSNLDEISSRLRQGCLDQEVRRCIFEFEIPPPQPENS